MTRFSLLPAAAALAFASAAFAPPLFAQEDHSAHGETMPAGEMSAASTAYMEAMTKMDQDMAGMTMTGKADVDFAAMMIPHHQSAIDMAEAYLASGDDDAELTKLATEIIAAQETEIAFLKGWLAKNAE